MAVTVLDLAAYRWKRQRGGEFPEQPTGGDFWSVDLDLMGGCEVCAASIAAYNACPTKTGFWRCLGCVADTGFETVEEAHTAIFENRK